MTQGKRNDGWGTVGTTLFAVGAGAVLMYLLTRQEVNDLKKMVSDMGQRIDQLNVRVQTQSEHMQTFRQYVAEQDRKITALEGNIDAIITDLEYMREQIKAVANDPDVVDKIMSALIEKARQHRGQATGTENIAAYN